MIYLFQRLIQNDNQWVKPSHGRLGRTGEGEYVQKNGFGHEDWNFNHDLSINGHLYGYCYYRPAYEKQNENFNIAFSIYKNKRWQVVGFYLNAKYIETPPINKEIIEKKIIDLKDLGDSLGRDWRKLSNRGFYNTLKVDAGYLNWKCAINDVIPTKYPILFQKKVFDTKNFRITNPTEIDEKVFNELFTIALKEIPRFDPDMNEELEFPEGREVERKHKQRERNTRLVELAKEKFKKQNGSLYCQICHFDFYQKYGEIGKDFIEAHHTLPIRDMVKNQITKIEDIAMVCPNCHRILHRKRPWLTMSDLNNIIKK
jgi:5-methylcytosine-specific restriction protein A